MENQAVKIANIIKRNNEIKLIVNKEFRNVIGEIGVELNKQLKSFQIEEDKLKPSENIVKINSDRVANITVPMVVNYLKDKEKDIYQVSEDEIKEAIYELIELQLKLI